MALADILARVPLYQAEEAKIVRIPSQSRAQGREAGASGKPQADLSMALDLLDRAATAMDALQSRCGKLEALLVDAVKRSESEFAAAEARSSEWERRTRRLELDLLNAESKLKEAETRAQSADARAAGAERRAAVAEESTLEARNWLNSYYEKITKSFGSHSQNRPSEDA